MVAIITGYQFGRKINLNHCLTTYMKMTQNRASLVVQWLRIHLAMQGTQVQPWSRKIPHAAATAKSLQSCPTLCDPTGILQARALEWVAISFSSAWKWKVKGKLLSRVRLLATPWTAAYQAPPSMGLSRQSTGVGCHCLLRRSHMPQSN